MPVRRWSWPRVASIAALVVLAMTPPSRSAGRSFFSSLRLAKPAAVTATPASPGGGGTGRQLEDAIAGMVTHASKATASEAPRDVPSVDSATKLAGFRARVVRSRRDQPTFTVTGARDVDMPLDRAQLRTILDEAGKRDVATPGTLQGGLVQLHYPRGLHLQYGRCPPPVANTIQGQLQGPPPPSTDYGDCLVLTESPPARIAAPSELPVTHLMEIALELSGMSPNQTRAFQQRVDLGSALVLSIPRFMRSYDLVSVNDAPAMLMTTAGRRGPTFALVWSSDGLAYLLTGYGNPGDAVALAISVN